MRTLSPASTPPRVRTYCRLVIEKGEHQGMIFPLRDSVVSIGRGPDNTIQIIDARMSRNHTLVIHNNGTWYGRDLGSKNGTLHNDQLITGDTPLNHGDSLQVGDTVFVFEQDQQRPDGTAGKITTGVRVLEDDGVMVPSQVVKLRDELGQTADVDLFAVPTGDADRLHVVYQVADMISTVFDLDILLDRVVDLVQRYFGPDRVGVLLYDEQYGVMIPKVIRRPPDSTEDIVISNSIITRSVNDQAAVLVNDAPHDLRFQASDSIAIQRIHSAICAPFIYNNEALGVLYLDKRRADRTYDDNDLKLIAVIAHQAALAIANASLHARLLQQHAQELELQIARNIQEHLLPRTFPQWRGFDVAGLSRSAKMVGGDYYDMIELHDGRVLVVVADVSGKGVPAAILLASVRAALLAEARGLPEMGLQALVERLNHVVCRDVANNMFVTVFFGVLDLNDRTLTYCNAGHVHPMLKMPGGQIETLEAGGCFLGIMLGVEYDIAQVKLEPGSTLLLYTDGVTDTLNDKREMYGLQKLADLLNSSVGLPSITLCNDIETSLTNFRKGQELFDDFTLLVIKSL